MAASAAVWFDNNDMTVTLTGLQTSTSSTGYVNSSTGVKLKMWLGDSTSSQVTINGSTAAQTMTYVAASNGNYSITVQSTGVSVAIGTVLMAQITVNHSGLNSEWRNLYRVEYRRTT